MSVILEYELRALRGMLVAAVGIIETIIETADIDGPPQRPAPPAPEPPVVDVADGGVCRHPKTSCEARPVMGDPDQFYCNACQRTVSGKEGL